MAGKNKRIKDILGYLQEEIPDAPAQEAEDLVPDDEEEPDLPAEVNSTYLKRKPKRRF